MTTVFRLPAIIEEGHRPDKHQLHPGMAVPALWRGPAAGGKDEEMFFSESLGRTHGDGHLRPTTQQSVKTPLRVSHQLEITVYFSVYGQDARGASLQSNGPGELRMLRVTRNIVVPPVSARRVY